MVTKTITENLTCECGSSCQPFLYIKKVYCVDCGEVYNDPNNYGFKKATGGN